MDRFSKRPVVKRFQAKQTFAGRQVKRTVVTRRQHPALKGRLEKELKPMRPVKKGR